MDIKKENGLDRLIRSDAEKKRAKKRREITFREYLLLVKQDPQIAQNTYSRFMEIINDAGVEDIPENERLILVATRRYKLFAGLYGVEKPIQQVVTHLEVGAKRGSTGKQVVVLVGPPASGKSSVVRILMQSLENYRKREVFAIKNCPKHEEPLHLLPRYLRKQATLLPQECPEYPNCESRKENPHLHLGVTIKGDLCPPCRYFLESSFTDEDGTIRWWDVPVTTFTFSIQGRRGIGSFEPSDEKSSDITTLSGREVIGVTSVHGYNHPLAYELSGEIPAGERGIVEGREILSSDPAVLAIFFSVAEEQELKIQGSTFPHISTDTFIVGHCNLTVFKEFSSQKKYEGLHDRFFVIPFPYPLRIRDEISIYRKLIEQESDFIRLRKCHIAPGALELAATFAIMTRLMPSTAGIDPLTKAKVYNGDIALTELKDKDQRPIDLYQLLTEGQASPDISKREGMFGVSSRTILAALNTKLVEKAGAENNCLTPLTVIRSLREVFEHRMGIEAENIERYKLLLVAGEAQNVMSEYREWILQTVTRAFLRRYQDLRDQLFWRYIKEAQLYCALHQKIVRVPIQVERDPLTQKPKEPDVKFMREIEMHIPWNEQEAVIGRSEIIHGKAILENFGPESCPQLARACDKKLLADSKATLSIVLATDKPQSKEETERHHELIQELMQGGHCSKCAREAIEKAREFLHE
jgi:serine protein kinase